MDNPEKLATKGTQDEERENKTQHNMCWTPVCAKVYIVYKTYEGRGGRDPMVYGFTITCVISAYHH